MLIPGLSHREIFLMKALQWNEFTPNANPAAGCSSQYLTTIPQKPLSSAQRKASHNVSLEQRFLSSMQKHICCKDAEILISSIPMCFSYMNNFYVDHDDKKEALDNIARSDRHVGALSLTPFQEPKQLSKAFCGTPVISDRNFALPLFFFFFLFKAVICTTFFYIRCSTWKHKECLVPRSSL